MQISKYTICPDAELGYQGSRASWRSKSDDHFKHGFSKQSHRPTNVICDSYLSRVLNTADKLAGFPSVKRTPKTKIIDYCMNNNSELLLRTISRVQGLEGVTFTDTVNHYSLISYDTDHSQDAGLSPLEGLFSAIVDAVLVQRWDVKLENLSAPVIRNFDMEYALSHADAPRQKIWKQDEFKALVQGATFDTNSVPSHLNGVDAISYAFVQVIAPLGGRVTNYYGVTGAYVFACQASFQSLFDAIKTDIQSLQRHDETPTQTVLRAFSERSAQIRQAMNVESKNPKIEVIKELNRVKFPTGGRHRVDDFEQRLEKSLDKFDGFIKNVSQDLKTSPQTLSLEDVPKP